MALALTQAGLGLGAQCCRYQKWRLKNRKRTRPYQVATLAALGTLLVCAIVLRGHVLGDESLSDVVADVGGAKGSSVGAHQLSGGNIPQWRFEVENKGLVIFAWIVIVIYMFMALAILCDDYFVASLEIISERLNLSEDVAGATFMASASSAPELFTNVADTFFGSESNIGFGTIVGSAMFNILVIIAAAAIFSSGDLLVDWRPFARDVAFYVASILLLFGFFVNGEIVVWENVLLVILYALYIAWMFKNEYLLWKLCCGTPPQTKVLDGVLDSADLEMVSGENEVVPSQDTSTPSSDSDESAEPPVKPSLDFKGAVTAVMVAKQTMPDLETRRLSWVAERVSLMPSHRPRRRFRAAARAVIMTNYLGKRHMKSMVSIERSRSDSLDSTEEPQSPSVGLAGDDEKNDVKVDIDLSSNESAAVKHADRDDGDDDDEEEDLGAFGKVLSVLSAPLNTAFRLTIPDCTKEKWVEWYIVTFVMSIVWIGATSYVMVLFAEKAGNLIGISPIIMGVTVLAIGTSVPDALGSIFVARAGNAGMAVSNAIGSNVFDILIGLGLTWMIASAVSGPVQVCTDSLTVPIIVLLVTVLIVTAVMFLAKWRLTRWVGVALTTTYLAFVIWNIVDNNESCSDE